MLKKPKRAVNIPICRDCGIAHGKALSRGTRFVSVKTRDWIACREALGNEIVRLKRELNKIAGVKEPTK